MCQRAKLILTMANSLQRTDIVDPVAFVDNLLFYEPSFRLGATKRRRNVLPPNHKKEGYSVGGALAAFTDNVDGRSKQDILDATLLAQLYADTKSNRERDIKKWYGFYKEVLENLGFVIENVEVQQHHITDPSFKLKDIVKRSHREHPSSSDKLSEALDDLLLTFESLPEHDERVTLFDSLSGSGSTGNFQVFPCEEGPDGKVFFVLGTFFFQTLQQNTKILFANWESRNALIYKVVQKAILEPTAYRAVRQSVTSKLKSYSSNLVTSIRLES